MTYIDRCVDSPDGYVTTVTLAPPEEAERSQGVTLSWQGIRYSRRRRANMACRPASGDVVRQHRIVAEDQPCLEVGEYLHPVPFVMQTDGTRFLKTIIPSRKATRDYRRRRST